MKKTLSIRVAKLLAAFTAERGRWRFDVVRVAPECIEATDGAMIVRVQRPVSSEPLNGFIDRAQLQGKGRDIEVDILPSLPEGEFPATAHLWATMPTNETAAAAMRISAADLYRVAAAASLLSTSLIFSAHDDELRVLFSGHGLPSQPE